MKHPTNRKSKFGVRSESFVELDAKISSEPTDRLKALNEQIKNDLQSLTEIAAANCVRISGKPNL